MSASREPMSPQEAVEILESAGNEMSASGYLKFRYFWPRTVHYGVLDLRDVEDIPRYLAAAEWASRPENQTPEEREESEMIRRASETDIWPYLHKRTKRRRKCARIIRRLMRAQALLARLRPGTLGYAVLLAVIKHYKAALLALAGGGAQ